MDWSLYLIAFLIMIAVTGHPVVTIMEQQKEMKEEEAFLHECIANSYTVAELEFWVNEVKLFKKQHSKTRGVNAAAARLFAACHNTAAIINHSSLEPQLN